MYHERVRILDRLKEQIYRDKKVEMKAQIMVDVTLIFVVCAPNLLHHNNVEVTYVETSNFKMELVISIPLYYVAMFQFMVTVIETPFITTPTHSVVGMRFRP
jgi:hypothetical protein